MSGSTFNESGRGGARLMYGMLFKYPNDPEEVYDVNPELRCWDEFKELDYREMCFVMLVADVASPYRVYRRGRRTLDGHTGEYAMRIQACNHLGYMTPKQLKLSKKGKRLSLEDITKVEVAIELYKELQFADDLQALYDAKEKYIDIIKNFKNIKTEKISSAKLNSINNIIKHNILVKINTQIKDYEKLMDKEMQLPESKKVEEGQDPDEEPVKKSKDEKKTWSPDGV